MIQKFFYSVITITLCGIALHYIWIRNFNFYQWLIDKKLWIAAIILIIVVVTGYWRCRSNLKQLLFFSFSPTKFIEQCVEDSMQRNIEDNPDLKKRIESDENYRKQTLEDSRKQFTEFYNKLRNSIYKAFLTVFLIFICSILSAFIMVNFITITEKQIFSIQIISAFLILWALIGKMGWSIQTYGGKTIPEQINSFWFVFLNVIGIYFLFFTYFFNFDQKMKKLAAEVAENAEILNARYSILTKWRVRDASKAGGRNPEENPNQFNVKKYRTPLILPT